MKRKTFDVSEAKLTWPAGVVRRCRVPFRCDYHHGINGRCQGRILKGEYYFDSMQAKPAYAGGFGNLRFCMECVGGEEVK